jgi:hypothetical protein
VHDDDVIARYEEEFDGPPARRGSNRGFWMVLATMVLGGIFLIVEIFAHRPIANDIARTQHDLNEALSRAEAIRADAGSFASADAAALAGGPDDALSFVGPDDRSAGPGQVSVYASAQVWAASSRSRTGTCFSLKRTLGGETTYLIADGACTGREGLAAVDDRW